MVHPCQFCERTFSRKFNRDCHETQGSHKRLMQNQEEMSSQDTIVKIILRILLFKKTQMKDNT